MTTSATIIADTISLFGARITTFEVNVPRFILAEINTHRMIAKSAASSRAIPVKKRIASVLSSPFVPKEFGKNQSGMQAFKNLEKDTAALARQIWLEAVSAAVHAATDLADINTHKQIANRVLEPYAYVRVVLTGTEWPWFFQLRAHPDAQPEFQEVAAMMKRLWDENEPRGADNHLPYVTEEELAWDYSDEYNEKLALASAARCARVSYRLHDGSKPSLNADLILADKLADNRHLSPFDHVAEADIATLAAGDYWRWSNPGTHRQFWGWIPLRVKVEHKLGLTPNRDSFRPFTPKWTETQA